MGRKKVDPERERLLRERAEKLSKMSVTDGKFIVINSRQRAIRKGSIQEVAKARGLFGYVLVLRGAKMLTVSLEYETEEERNRDFELVIELLNI